MRKIIAILLVGVLLASGLGGLAYAQEDPVNDVLAHFITSWKYTPPEDTFTNDNVTGSRQWAAKIQNRTGETLASANLTLASDLEFDFVYPEPETMGPLTYEWSFGEIPVGGGKEVHVASERSNVTFTPGFDASRSADKTVFTATDNQTLTITVTPREAMDFIGMNVAADYPDWLNAAITSCKLEDGSGGDNITFNISPDGYWLWTRLDDPVVNTEYTYVVTIEVTPTVPKVECLPLVQVVNIPKGPIDSGGSGSSVDYTVDEMGTWTWNTSGIYTWAIAAGKPFRTVTWHRSSRQVVEPIPHEPIPHEPMTGHKLVGSGGYSVFPPELDGTYLEHAGSFILTNPDCVSEITIDRISIFDFNGTVVYEGDLFTVDWVDGTPEVTYWTEPLKPHERRWIEVDSTMVYLRDQGYWEGDHILFTVEICWSYTDKEGLPLIGWAGGRIAKRDAEGHIIEFQVGSATQMVNMVQVLIPEEEKEVTTLRLQTWFAPEDPLMVPLENFAQAVEDGTKGLVRIELYSTAAPLVPFWELAEAVKQGDVEMGLLYSMLLRDYSRVVDAGWLPFLYNDDDGLMAAVQAGIGDLMTEEMVAHNITVLDWTTTAFSHLYSRDTMLAHPDALTSDVKIRVIGGTGGAHEGMQWEAITKWGGKPVTLPFTEIYELLRDGKIHGAIHSPYLYEVMKFYEVAPYFSMDYAFANLAGLCINSDIWNSLDAKTQHDIAKAADDFAIEMLDTVKLLDAEALQRIEGYEGVIVDTLAPEERLVWREASQPVWQAWLDEVGPVGEDIIDIALEHNPLP